jgi:serine/threonine protein kinase
LLVVTLYYRNKARTRTSTEYTPLLNVSDRPFPHGSFGMDPSLLTTLVIIPQQDVSIGGVIGVGAFGKVCAAMYAGQPVCVKMFHVLENPRLFNLGEDDDTFQLVVNEILREADRLATLHHPHIVRIYGICCDAHNVPMCLVLELAHDHLGRYLRGLGRQSTATEVRGFARDILLGLEYLHSRQPPLIHRDLKPENVLVFLSDQRPLLKIGDVGLSRESASRTMSQVGTLFFMAPEMCMGGHYDTGVDVYSFGMLLASVVNMYCCDVGVRTLDSSKKTEIVENAHHWLLCDQAADMAAMLLLCCEPDPHRRCTAAHALSLLQ